jgi:hypothetical protein
MKIANSLLFVACVLGAGSLLPAQDHQSVASPSFFSMSGIVLHTARTSGMTPDEVAALLSDSAGYSDPSANTSDDPPPQSMTSPDPSGNDPVAYPDPGMAIDNYNALVGQEISPTNARQIVQITRGMGI